MKRGVAIAVFGLLVVTMVSPAGSQAMRMIHGLGFAGPAKSGLVPGSIGQ